MSRLRVLCICILQTTAVLLGAEVENQIVLSETSENGFSIGLGNVHPNEQKSVSIKIINDLAKDVTITNVHTSCGCLTATISSDRVAPNHAITLSINIKSPKRLGAFTESLILTSFDSPEKILINYSGVVSALYRFSPDNVAFGTIDSKTNASRAINLGSADFNHLPDDLIVRPDSDFLEAHLIRTPHEGTRLAIIELSLYENAPLGQVSGSVFIMSKAMGFKIPVKYSFQRVGKYSAIPSFLFCDDSIKKNESLLTVRLNGYSSMPSVRILPYEISDYFSVKTEVNGPHQASASIVKPGILKSIKEFGDPYIVFTDASGAELWVPFLVRSGVKGVGH